MLGVPTPSFPAAQSQQRQGGSGRSKVALKPGRSLMDWIKLTKGNKDLQGFQGRMRAITMDELALHNTMDDCWMAIRGQVYNVSHYMEYHPGGAEELMKGAGIDATDLFDGVHKWVNFASMLAKCHIGPLKYELKLKPTKKIERRKENGFLVPQLPLIIKDPVPRYEWYEKTDQIIVTIYIKQSFSSSDILIDCEDGKVLDIKILFHGKYYWINIELENLVNIVLLQAVAQKKIEVALKKMDDEIKWTKLGKPLPGHNTLEVNKERELKFRDCKISHVQQVTHDTKLYTINLPSNCYNESPMGFHVKVRADIDGIECVRSYTVAIPSFDPKSIENQNRGRLIYLMIKHYETGTLTPFLDSLKTGDSICVSDCLGSFSGSILKDKSRVHLIAAGTGLTPMLRVISHCLYKSKNNCKLTLLFANKKQNDILWKREIDSEVSIFPSRFHCSYILSHGDEHWNGLQGRIEKDTLETFLNYDCFAQEKNAEVLINSTPSIAMGEFFAVCGPDEFTLYIKRLLIEIGISESDIHCFMG